MPKPKTGGRIHSSDISRIGNVAGVNGLEIPEPTPLASKETCADRASAKMVPFNMDNLDSSNY
jgi:hypothetical protein